MNSQTSVTNQAASGEMTVKDWLVTYLILFLASLIPFLPVIILLYWAFSENTVPCKKNWAKASLIFYLIVAVLAILFFMIFGASIMANMEGMQQPM